ncbi:GRIP domain-containing protein RUD3-like [Pyrus ussuriensis x Pyrus communis]|uniref:GRIP domain-containing protein RUD3-like n=1 Tax=Pyrus ussuriensis x Pyrus communis TaxID=2448454 RepID=A0A5N5FGX2_9ROSA|nr:GRIP domain-containing protein RUD3-like [Pyrus ussuriensis x Pyrus communis]
MSESGSPSDEGSPSSSSRFELAMLESLGPLLEACTKETLDDFRNCQTLANIGSSSFMLVGKRVVFDAIPIFRSEFTADLLEKNLLDSERQVEALRQSCSIPRSVGMCLVHHEEWPSEPPKGHVMFYTQILLTLGVNFCDTLIGLYIIWMECGLGEPSFNQWRYCYKMRPVKACPGYAKCACRSERERIVFGKKKAYCTWKNRWCFLYNDWEHVRGVIPERRVLTHFQTVVTRGNIKLSRRELANVEKVLRVPKEDRHLSELWPFKKGGTSTQKGKAPMLVPVDDILFHKGSRKYRVRLAPRPKSQEEVLKITASKRAEVEAIGCVAAIVTGEER